MPSRILFMTAATLDLAIAYELPITGEDGATCIAASDKLGIVLVGTATGPRALAMLVNTHLFRANTAVQCGRQVQPAC